MDWRYLNLELKKNKMLEELNGLGSVCTGKWIDNVSDQDPSSD